MKRALYTLSAAAALFGAAPATTRADAVRSSSVSCPCTAADVGAAAARPDGSTKSREEEFLREVWSAP